MTNAKYTLLAIILTFHIAGCGSAERDHQIEDETAIAAQLESPAGDYQLDKAHSSIVFRISHIGFSFYTGHFTNFDVSMSLDPASPESAALTATIDLSSLQVPAPPEGFRDILLGPDWFDAGAHPQMIFRSTSIERTEENEAIINGELTLRGVTQPVRLEARFNGGYAGLENIDPQARIGFSANGTLRRSAFGMDLGLPPAGSDFGVGDEVAITIETEFIGPPLNASASENQP